MTVPQLLLLLLASSEEADRMSRKTKNRIRTAMDEN